MIIVQQVIDKLTRVYPGHDWCSSFNNVYCFLCGQQIEDFMSVMCRDNSIKVMPCAEYKLLASVLNS